MEMKSEGNNSIFPYRCHGDITTNTIMYTNHLTESMEDFIVFFKPEITLLTPDVWFYQIMFNMSRSIKEKNVLEIATTFSFVIIFLIWCSKVTFTGHADCNGQVLFIWRRYPKTVDQRIIFALTWTKHCHKSCVVVLGKS